MPIKKITVKTKSAPKKKPVAVKREAKKKAKKEEEKISKFFEGLGRRKTATARVRILVQGEKTNLVNGKPLEIYFPTNELRETVLSPFKKMECLEQFGLSVRVRGGGISSQAEAVRHGIAKALVLFDPEMRKRMKKTGYLTRDPRMRERKKFGLKRARKAPQWAKR